MRATRRQWPIFAVLAAIVAVLLYQGTQYAMQLFYNRFLISLLLMSVALVVIAWRTGDAGGTDEENKPRER